MQAEKKFLRRNLRQKDYDYSQAGPYFVTICCHDRQKILSKIGDEQVIPTDFGKIVELTWIYLPNHYANVLLDEFIIMPDHIHGIIFVNELVSNKNVAAGSQSAKCIRTFEAGLKPATTRMHALSEIIRGFKTFSSKRINNMRGCKGEPVWQRGYYEHIIRDEKSLLRKEDTYAKILFAGKSNIPYSYADLMP